MKQKFAVCAFARHTLAAGLLFPAVVCAVYIAGILSGAIAVDYRYDAVRLIRLCLETFACCAVVATACAFFADWLYRRLHP